LHPHQTALHVALRYAEIQSVINPLVMEMVGLGPLTDSVDDGEPAGWQEGQAQFEDRFEILTRRLDPETSRRTCHQENSS
jgi:hypothetical protein